MTQFHEGQDVEVWARHPDIGPPECATIWRKAKIVRNFNEMPERYKPNEAWLVEFPHGTRAVFNAKHIRATGPTPANLSKESRRILNESPDRFNDDGQFGVGS